MHLYEDGSLERIRNKGCWWRFKVHVQVMGYPYSRAGKKLECAMESCWLSGGKEVVAGG